MNEFIKVERDSGYSDQCNCQGCAYIRLRQCPEQIFPDEQDRENAARLAGYSSTIQGWVKAK